MPNFAANLTMMYEGPPFLDRFAAAGRLRAARRSSIPTSVTERPRGSNWTRRPRTGLLPYAEALTARPERDRQCGARC